MAGVDIESGGNERKLNRELNMIPFIDLLMVTVAFLLITAVWVSHARVNADAMVPGDDDGPIDVETKVLHLYAKENNFELVWKQGPTVLSQSTIPRQSSGNDQASYADLAKKISAEWSAHGAHTDPADHVQDRCVLHVDDAVQFREIVATMDAIYAAKRDVIWKDGKRDQMTAFNTVFATR